MKKGIRIIAGALVIVLCLTGCGFVSSNYVSSYRATMLVRSETSDSARMSFSTFDGRMVFRLRSGGHDIIRSSIKLESGSATVSYAAGGTKTEWFTVNTGDEGGNSAGPLEKGTVYVIIETSETCREGSFRFDVEDDGEE